MVGWRARTHLHCWRDLQGHGLNTCALCTNKNIPVQWHHPAELGTGDLKGELVALDSVLPKASQTQAREDSRIDRE
jgi:hypothetical protein